MARPSGPKTRCGGEWTEARFNSFVKSALRQASRRWAPNSICKKNANISRGVYECAQCKKHVGPTYRNGRKRSQNIFIDHIKPIVDPTVGWTTYDDFINNLFCEVGNLQLLCKDCHDTKTQIEKEQAVKRRQEEKL